MPRALWKPLVIGAVIVCGLVGSGRSAELKVSTRPDMVPVLLALRVDIQREIGAAVVLTTRLAGAAQLPADAFDVIVDDEPTIEALKSTGKIAPLSVSCIAYTGLAVVGAAETALPEIGNVEAFRKALLSARSIAFAGRTTTGAQARGVLTQLGIVDRLASKLIDSGVSDPMALVAEGVAELALALESEAGTAHGIQLVGPFPPELQQFTAFFAALSSDTAERERGERLVALLSSFNAIKVLHNRGFDTTSAEWGSAGGHLTFP
jgi:molybdate transport system substrate-binding protein